MFTFSKSSTNWFEHSLMWLEKQLNKKDNKTTQRKIERQEIILKWIPYIQPDTIIFSNLEII